MSRHKPSSNPDNEFRHWNRVYLAVVINLVLVIAVLWLFAKNFE